jgi:multidrug efflux pump subunit AcrA (membrane-fusion protein)
VTRGRIIAAVVALVVIAAIVLGIMASAASRTPQVSVAEVQKTDLTQTVTASGQIEGDVKADVFAPVVQGTLTIKSILVADGQKVKAGQVLATLDVIVLVEHFHFPKWQGHLHQFQSWHSIKLQHLKPFLP